MLVYVNGMKLKDARGVTTIDWSLPPLESQLADHTVWPGNHYNIEISLFKAIFSELIKFFDILEISKLYGHSNEVICMDISSSGQFIASASKARDSSAARILVWSSLHHDTRPFDMQNMRLVGSLGGHDSTIACLRFSPNDK